MKLMQLTATDGKDSWPIYINPQHLIWCEYKTSEKKVFVRCDAGGMFFITQTEEEIKKIFEDSVK